MGTTTTHVFIAMVAGTCEVKTTSLIIWWSLGQSWGKSKQKGSKQKSV